MFCMFGIKQMKNVFTDMDHANVLLWHILDLFNKVQKTKEI